MLRERADDGNGNPILAAVGTLQFDGEFIRIACNARGMFSATLSPNTHSSQPADKIDAFTLRILAHT